ncbi:MAG TPA: hypothetical protein VLQ68_13285 [Rhizobiaceae bacterium]|nr:hypothetical protein [Rhizobiaceae bacterium]
MAKVLSDHSKRLGGALRLAVFAAILGISSTALMASGLAYASDAQGTADAGSDASASGSGEGTSGSGQDSSSGAESESSPGGGSASGAGTSSAGAEQSGDGGSIGADTAATAAAAAEKSDDGTSAAAAAAASANVAPGKKTTLAAGASATTVSNPASSASTNKNGTTTTSATAAYRQPGTYYCSDTCNEGYTKTTGKKTVSVAMQDDAYSLAVASKKSAYAKAGALSDFTKKEQKSITKALSVDVFASAKKNSARATAFANAFGEIQTSGDQGSRVGFAGIARASSYAKATACVGGNCLSKPVQAKSVTIVKDCDRTERVIGFFKFPVCEYRVVTR